MSRDGLHLPTGSPRAYVYEDISKQFSKGALLWEIKGVAKPREDTSMEKSPRVYDWKQGSGIEPGVRVCLDIGTSVGIQGLPVDSRPLQLDSRMLVYISRSSKMIYTSSPCSSAPVITPGGRPLPSTPPIPEPRRFIFFLVISSIAWKSINHLGSLRKVKDVKKNL